MIRFIRGLTAAMLAMVVCLGFFSTRSAWATGPGLDITPPGAILSLTAVAGTVGGSVKLTWTNPADTDGLRYVVRNATFAVIANTTNWFTGLEGASYNYVQAWSTGAAATSQTQTALGLTEGVTYYFGLALQDTHNNYNLTTAMQVSSANAPNIAPAAIANLTAQADTSNEQGVLLAWTATGDDGTVGTALQYTLVSATWPFALATDPTSQAGITVLVSSNNPAASLLAAPRAGGAAESFIVKSLTPGATFYFQIKALDEVGNYSYSNQPSSLPRTDTAAPLAITQISAAIGTNDGEVSLTWTAPPDQNGAGQLIPRYVVNWQTVGFPPLLSVAELSANTTTAPEIVASTWTSYRMTAAVTGLTRRALYTMTVRPKDAAGNVGPYLIVVATTAKDGAAPQAVGTVSISTNPSGGRADLSFTAPGDDGISTGPAVASYMVVYATYAPSDPAGGAVLSSDVVAWWNGAQGTRGISGKTGAVQPGQTDSVVIKGLAGPLTAYYFVVGSSDAVGNSSPLSAWTTSPAVAGDAVSPAAIADLAGSRDTVAKTVLNVSWTAPSDPNSAVASYIVKWATGGVVTNTTAWWGGTESTVTVTTYAQALVPSTTSGAETLRLTAMPTQAVTIMIRSQDLAPNLSSFSNTLAIPAFVDVSSPNAVVDLAVSSTSIAAVSSLWAVNLNTPPVGKVELTWTAPGDDGAVGNVSAMLVRYSTGGSIDTEAVWSTATIPTGAQGPLKAPSVLNPGIKQSYVVSGLTVGTTYWFAVRGQDAVGNLGPISSGSLLWALPNQAQPISYLLSLDTAGVPSHLNEYYAVGPVSITVVLSGTSGIIADGSGRGIQATRLTGDHVTSSFLGAPNPAEGGRLTGVIGKVTHFNGLAQLRDIFDMQGPVPFPTANLPAPLPVTASQLPGSQTAMVPDPSNPEAREHALVALRGVHLVAIASNTWPIDGSAGVNVQVEDDTGPAQVTVRFEQGTNMAGTIVPDLAARFDVVGSQGQYDTSSPYFGGYQISPPSGTAANVSQGIGIIERPRALSALGGNLSVTLTWAAVTDPNRNGFTVYASSKWYSVPAPGDTPSWTNTVSISSPAATQITVTSGLTTGTTYFFYVAMKQVTPELWQQAASAGGVFTESGSPMPNGFQKLEVASGLFGGAADITPPSGITNLSGLPGAAVEGTVALTWTAPGNDGLVGTATRYLIRYATWPTGGLTNTTDWWDGALTPPAGARPVETYLNPKSPAVQGTTEQMTLSGLVAGATYYIAIKAMDGAGNVGTLSNWISAPASDLAPPAPTGVTLTAVDKALTVTWAVPSVANGGPTGGSVPMTDVTDFGYRIYYNIGRQGWGVVTGGQNTGPDYPSGGTGAYDVVVTTVILKAGIAKTPTTRTYTIGQLQNGVPTYLVVAAVDSKGNIGAAAEVSATPVTPPNLKITEVMPFGPNDQPGSGSGKDQFIELYNASDVPADASRWILMTRSMSGSLNNNFVKAFIPTGTVLGARQHYLVAFTQNAGLYRAGTRAGIVYPQADYDQGDPETADPVNLKPNTVYWGAGQGPGKSAFGISMLGSSISLLTPGAEAALDKTTLGSWKIPALNMKAQPLQDRITFRTAVGTVYVSWTIESDGLPDLANGFPGGGKIWPDGNGRYLDTETNYPAGVGPAFATRPSSWTVSFQRVNENVDNDRLDDWTLGLANPGASADAAPPAPIVDLRVSGTDTSVGLTDGVDAGILLTFTAPGDDGTAPGNVGGATAYLVNYSTSFPTGGSDAALAGWLNGSTTYVDASPRTLTFGANTYLAPSWIPLPTGSVEKRRVASANMVAGVNYTFLVRGIDDVGNVLPPQAAQFIPSSVGSLRVNPATVGRFLAAGQIGTSTQFTRRNLTTKKVEMTPGHLANTGNPDLGQADTLVAPAGSFAYNPYTPSQNTVTVTLMKDGAPINVSNVVGGVKVGGTSLTGVTANSFPVAINADGSMSTLTIGDRSGIKIGDAVNVPDQVDILTSDGVKVTRYNDSSAPAAPGDGVFNAVKPSVDSGAGTITGSKGTVESFGTVIFYGQNPVGKTRAELTGLEIKAAAPGRANGAPYSAFASTAADTNGGFPTTVVGTKASTVYVVVKDAAGNLSPAFLAPFLPLETKLDAFGPNPFKPSKYQGDYSVTETPRETFYFNLKEDTNVNLLVFNAGGELVKTLLDNQAFSAGYGRAFDGNGTLITKDTARPNPADAVSSSIRAVSWDGKNEAGTRVASGVYLLRFEAGGVKTTKKMLVIQ